MPDRVAVFIDYQNCYKGARESFFYPWSAHMKGQVFPRRVGLVLRDHAAGDRELAGVWVYRGMPSSKHDAKGQAAADRQVAMWEQQAMVHPVTRALNYRDPTDPKEKGIDVRLAIDMVMMAMRNVYDIAVLFSDDTDLVPALESVIEIKKRVQAVEVATWAPTGKPAPRQPLRSPGNAFLIHRLYEADYGHVEDDTDYNLRRRRR